MTPFCALQQLCGLSNCEAAGFLAVAEDTINSWRSGRRGAPPGVIAELQCLWTAIDEAAVSAAETLDSAGVPDNEDGPIEIGYPADDAEAREFGLPCVGAWRQMAARLIDELMIEGLDPARLRLVPRGSTLATAAAIKAREAE